MVSQEQNELGKTLFSPKPGEKCGPLLLGFLVDAILLGVLIMNFIRWYTWSRPQEKPIIKVLVYWLLCHALGYSSFLVAMNSKFFVYHFGEWGVFFDLSFLQWTFLLETISRTPVSVFFAARAYRLSGQSKVFVAVITPLFLTSIAGAIWARITPEKLFGTPRGNIPVFMWIGAEVASDLIITGFITYHLAKSRTGWKQTDRMIRKLVVLAIETQLPPTFFATIYLVFIGVPSLSALASFFCFMPNTYAITTLIVLNQRYALRREFDHEASTKGGVDTHGVRSRRGLPAGNIQVITEVIRHVDEAPAQVQSDKASLNSLKGNFRTTDFSHSMMAFQP